MTSYNYKEYDGQVYIQNGGGTLYKFRINHTYTTSNKVVAAQYKNGEIREGYKWTGRINFKVQQITLTSIIFLCWFSSDNVDVDRVVLIRGTVSTFLKAPIATSLAIQKADIMEFSFYDFFQFLDRAGESWDKYRADAVNFNPIALTVVKDFSHKKNNLKGLKIKVVESHYIKENKEDGSISKTEFCLCRFEKDIGGSCLDGKSSKKDHLFLPRAVLGTETKKEEKKPMEKMAIL